MSETAARSDLMALAASYAERQQKLHDLLETIREKIRLGIPADQRPEGLFRDIQDAVYAMRGRPDIPAAIRLAASQPDREAVARVMRGHIEYGFDGPMARQESIIGIDEAADAILSLLSGAGTKSDGPGMRVRDNPRSHGESLQQGPDTSSTTGTASESPQGEVADAASVAKQVTATDRASLAVPGPSDPSPGPDVRRRVLDILNAVAPAVENLAGHQEQCDMDGVMVKVSRQALDEVLNAVNEVALVSALTRPLGGT